MKIYTLKFYRNLPNFHTRVELFCAEKMYFNWPRQSVHRKPHLKFRNLKIENLQFPQFFSISI